MSDKEMLKITFLMYGFSLRIILFRSEWLSLKYCSVPVE